MAGESALCKQESFHIIYSCAIFAHPSQLEPIGDPTQPRGVLFDVVHLRDLRRRVPKQVGDLPRRQGFDRAVGLLDAVDKVRGERVSDRVQALLLDTCRFKENRPTCETVTTFTPGEIEKFKAEAYRTWSNGERVYQQAAAYTLMFNTGLRTGEVLGLLNSDVDLDKKVLHLQRGVKEVSRRDGVEFTSGREVKIGKLKSASSKREVPLNQAAIDAILDLRTERYFGEDAPLIPNENGGYTRPVNFRRRYYRILEAAGIEQKGLHSIRHTFATNLVNGIKQPDGTIKSLTPRQVADLLGHSTSEITEMYYVKKDTARLSGITEGFEL